MVVATGRLDGDASQGKVSLLGGHEYSTSVPYTSNDEVSAVRVFINSYFTADCANLSFAPNVALDGTPTSSNLDLSLLLDYENSGVGRGRYAELVLTLPAGLNYRSDDSSGTWDSATSTVTWSLGTLASGETGATTTEMDADAEGTYTLSAELSWYVEATRFSTTWTETSCSRSTRMRRARGRDEEELGTDRSTPTPTTTG